MWYLCCIDNFIYKYDMILLNYIFAWSFTLFSDSYIYEYTFIKIIDYISIKKCGKYRYFLSLDIARRGIVHDQYQNLHVCFLF